MVSNYFTLLHVARQLHRDCAGKIIAETYSQVKQTLSIVVDPSAPVTITLSCIPGRQFISSRPGSFRAKKNSVDLLTGTAGKKILSVHCHPHDRIIYLVLEQGSIVCVELFGPSANVFLLSSNGDVIDALRNAKDYVGSTKEIVLPKHEPHVSDFLHGDVLAPTARQTTEDDSVLAVLKKRIPTLGTPIAKEIVFRAGIAPSAPVNTLNELEVQAIKTSLREVLSIIVSEGGPSYIYYDEESPVCFSIFPLTMYAQYRSEQYSTVFDGIRRFIGTARSSSAVNDEKKQLQAWLEKEQRKIKNIVLTIERESEDTHRADDYEMMGKLLLNNLSSLKKGMKEIELAKADNDTSPDRGTTIPLDRSLSPQENAQRYFTKAKKARIAVKDAEERKIFLLKKLNIISNLNGKITEVHTRENLKDFLSEHRTSLRAAGFMTKEEQAELPPFRIFTVEGGFQVLAGKSSANNDLLTLRYAKPNDLWFHCRGAGGSHVVLKIGSAEGVPSKKAVEQAASIAAYYSKMKNATRVPVVVTEKKYVRKPKGAPPGTVILEREKVIVVEPQLPEDLRR